MALQIHQDRTKLVATSERKIIYSKVEDRARREIGKIHDAAQDRLAGGLHAQTGGELGSPFATGGQSNGSDLLAVADRHPGPWVHKGKDALSEDFPLTQALTAGKVA